MPRPTLHFKLTGVAEVDTMLKTLAPAVANKLAMEGFKEAAKLVLSDAVARAPARSGTLRKSLKVRPIKSRRLKSGAKVVATKRRKKRAKKFSLRKALSSVLSSVTKLVSRKPRRSRSKKPKQVKRGSFSLKRVIRSVTRQATNRILGKPARTADGYYFHMVEFGTKRFAPRPFLNPALASQRDAVVAKLKEYVEAEVAKARE